MEKVVDISAWFGQGQGRNGQARGKGPRLCLLEGGGGGGCFQVTRQGHDLPAHADLSSRPNPMSDKHLFLAFVFPKIAPQRQREAHRISDTDRHDPEAVCAKKKDGCVIVWLQEDKKRETCGDTFGRHKGRQIWLVATAKTCKQYSNCSKLDSRCNPHIADFPPQL